MNLSLSAPVFVMAGGTGGHVFPAIAVAECLREQGKSVIWLGTRAGLEARLVPEAGFPIEWINIGGLRGSGLLSLIKAPFRLLTACLQAWRAFRQHRPGAVLGMGGFAAGPGGLVAWLMRVPLFVHEQNSIPGLTNRCLGRLARKNYVAFPAAAESFQRVEVVGNPVREDLLNLPEPAERMAARKSAALNLLVIGGSLGAASLNRLLPEAVSQLSSDEQLNIRHQCGGKHLDACQAAYDSQQVKAEIQQFIDDMPAAYQWADLVVCRAGALTVAELAAVGVAALLVPYPYAVDDHQFHNARFLEQAGAARIVREADLSADSLAEILSEMTADREALISMAQKARGLAQTDAAETVARDILEVMEDKA